MRTISAWRFWLLLVLGALVLLAAGCGTTAEGGDGEEIEVRFGFGSHPDYSDLNSLRMLEILKEEYGINAKAFYFEGENLAYQALAAGAVDIAVGGLGAAIRLADESEGEKPIMVSATVTTTDYVIVSRPEIETLKDLEGKKFGISGPGAISDVIPRIVLQENGVDPEKVTWVRIGGTSARMASIHAGETDAGAAHAADGLNAARQGLKVLETAAPYIPDYVQRGLFVSDAFLQANEELVKKVVYADIDAARWAAENREEYNELARQELEGIDPSILDEAYAILYDGRVWGVDGGMNRERLERTMEIELSVGNIERALPVEEWTDSRFQEAYLAEKGESEAYK